ncbi:hypothetical protein [Fibrobacter sp.]|uniref:hypothetical protein n=1 Tax=Fibrobacter sp. TaxID=35828 RepID=UPI003890F6C6
MHRENLLDGAEFVIRKGNTLCYAGVELSVGHQTPDGKSIDLETGDVLQLHDFSASADAVSSVVDFQTFTNPVSGDVLVRKYDEATDSYELGYANLELKQNLVSCDSESGRLRSRSLEYRNDVPGFVQQLYNFPDGCATSVRPVDVSASSENGVLVRRERSNVLTLEYMPFEDIAKFSPDYSGDADNGDDKSISRRSLGADSDGQAREEFELWNWRNNGTNAVVTIHTDGKTYAWPQNTQEAVTPDYILVKHVDSSGKSTLQYRQLMVQMPTISVDISDLSVQVQNIQSQVDIVETNVTNIFEIIGDLSAEISGMTGDFWEQGGDSSVNYGSDIGDSSRSKTIDLD